MTAMTSGCPYCGSYWHSGICPRIESIEYYPGGGVKAVKLRDERPALVPQESP